MLLLHRWGRDRAVDAMGVLCLLNYTPSSPTSSSLYQAPCRQASSIFCYYGTSFQKVPSVSIRPASPNHNP